MSRGRIGIIAGTPYPVQLVRTYFLSRAPLYGQNASLEFARLMARPPRRLEARAGVYFETSAEEGVTGAGRRVARYLKAPLPAFALERPACEPGKSLSWKELVTRLEAGKLAALDDWCRLLELGLLQLEQRRAATAVKLWRGMLSRIDLAPRATRLRPAVENALAVSLAAGGRMSEARPIWERRALDGDAHAAYNLGLERTLAGDPKNAARWYRAALERSPGYTLARERLTSP